MPGEEFSFNEVVGPRNEKTGYKSAHVFVNGRVEDGIGGGICQATSTLYNAVLLADLEVVERRNHSFIVTYVPLGQDATAYYGGTDLRFINNTGWPIKILSWVEGNKVNCVFLGTNSTPEKTVVISTKTLSHTPYKTKYVDDPALPVGTVKKSQYGTDGFVVETYKTVKMGDKVISQKKIHTSSYKPCDEEFLVGIKQPDGTLTPGLAAQMATKAKAAAQAETAPADTQPATADKPAVDEKPGTEPVRGETPGTSGGSPETSASVPDTPENPGDVPSTPETSDNDTVSRDQSGTGSDTGEKTGAAEHPADQ